jgi:polysaccharide export outer membrane protein
MIFSNGKSTGFVFSLIMIMGISMIMTSCVNTRKATYFNYLGNTVDTLQTIPESYIQKNDILSINVSSLNPEATEIYNTPNVIKAPYGSDIVTGYLVNSDGFIQFPVLGNVNAAGLTKDQFKNKLTQTLVDKKLLVDPIVTVRYQNFRVTVLGEVKNPAVIPVANERITLLEALGLAGDLTIYAKRDNVMLIREENGIRTTQRLNLNSTQLFHSPYYYLQSNDIIYVEPNKSKVAGSGRSQQLIPILLGAISIVVVVLTRVIK